MQDRNAPSQIVTPSGMLTSRISVHRMNAPGAYEDIPVKLVEGKSVQADRDPVTGYYEVDGVLYDLLLDILQVAEARPLLARMSAKAPPHCSSAWVKEV